MRSVFWYQRLIECKQPEPKSYLTAENSQNSCERVSTDTLHKKMVLIKKIENGFLIKAADSLTNVQWLLYQCINASNYIMVNTLANRAG